MWRLAVVHVCLAVATVLPAQTVEYKAYGLNFSPYLDGQDPAQNLPVSASQIQQRLAIIAPYTERVRTFGCLNGLGETGRLARDLGLMPAIGAWIGRDLTANDREVDCAISVAQSGNAAMVIVGSEVLLRGDVTEQQLLAYMQKVRSAVPTSVAVTTADAYRDLLIRPAVLAASDVIMANFYPYWENFSLDSAIGVVDGAYRQLVAAANGKAVVVSETGWPSAGNIRGAAVPSPANAAEYFLRFVSWARSNNVPYYYFEAFDEQWKAQHEGPQGAAWGIWDSAGRIKTGMSAVFAGQVVTPPPSATCRAGGTPSVHIDFVGPVGDTRPVYGHAGYINPTAYRIATYILVGSGWWTKPYFNAPLATIREDCTFEVPIATGGSDDQATRVRTYLVPADYVPPPADGGQLPVVNAVAMAEAVRGGHSICGTVTTSSGASIAGATIALSGTSTLTARTVSNGQYCFANLEGGGNYTIAATAAGYNLPPPQNFTGLTGHRIVNFTAISCVSSVVPANANVPATGATSRFVITSSDAGCSWTASSNASWAQVFPLSGAGGGNISYRVFPNFSSAPRTATVTVAGQSFVIQQSGNTGSRRQRFVRLLYFSLFGRIPSDNEVAIHDLSGLPEAVLAKNFWVSGELGLTGRLVAGLYVGILGRNAEYGGWQFQRLALADGVVTQTSITRNFLESDEWKLQNGILTDEQFVHFLYASVLARTASAAETETQLANLRHGTTREQMATYFLASPEFLQKTTVRLDAFLLYAGFLMRDPSTSEREAIIDEITRGIPIDVLLTRVVESAEFNQLLQ